MKTNKIMQIELKVKAAPYIHTYILYVPGKGLHGDDYYLVRILITLRNRPQTLSRITQQSNGGILHLGVVFHFALGMDIYSTYTYHIHIAYMSAYMRSEQPIAVVVSLFVFPF